MVNNRRRMGMYCILGPDYSVLDAITVQVSKDVTVITHHYSNNSMLCVGQTRFPSGGLGVAFPPDPPTVVDQPVKTIYPRAAQSTSEGLCSVLITSLYLELALSVMEKDCCHRGTSDTISYSSWFISVLISCPSALQRKVTDGNDAKSMFPLSRNASQ